MLSDEDDRRQAERDCKRRAEDDQRDDGQGSHGLFPGCSILMQNIDDYDECTLDRRARYI